MPQTRSRISASTAPSPEHRNANANTTLHVNGSATGTSPPHSTSTSTSSPGRSPARSPLYSPRHAPDGPVSLTSIALQSLSLGALLALSLSLALQLLLARHPLWRVPLFVAVCALFHFLEFWCTARWNSAVADRTSFLIVANGVAQGLAYLLALLEAGVREMGRRRGWWVGWSWLEGWGAEGVLPSVSTAWVVGMGLALIVLGQTARSMAMREAGASFNHLVQYYKRDDHVLVTSGIYRWVRHPSYFGFFYWALGTQLVLGNHFSFFAYALALWKFFSHRVLHEERYLITFFGDDYREYRSRTPTLIPFVG